MKKQRKIKKNDSGQEEIPSFPMRINRYLAWKKHSTRRGADELIKKRQVFKNGRLAVLGDKVVATDTIEVRFSGKMKPLVYFAYNKAKGLMNEVSEKGDRKISYEVSLKDVFPVGMLDKDSHGLVIVTNDRRVTDRLTGGTQNIEKEYLVATYTELRPNFKEKMEGVTKLERDRLKPCHINIVSDYKFKITIVDDKKNQIRRMCALFFQKIEDIKRTRVANIELGNLIETTRRKIEGDELKNFLHALDLT